MAFDTLEKILKDFFGKSVRLTRKIHFLTKDNTLNIHINNPDSNIQHDGNAFEGWSFAFHLAGFDHIHLSWDSDNIRDSKHYNRFLYRIVKFQERFPWLTSDDFESCHIFGDGVTKFINHGTEPASVKNNPQSESAYEEKLYRSHSFQKHHNIGDGMLTRQIPVGVFLSNPPTASNALFTGRCSAIDLCGIDKNGILKLFELKIDGNKKVGALSEIFFYSCIVDDVKNGFIQPTNDGFLRDSKITWKDIINSKHTENYIISSGSIHPIVKRVCSSNKFEKFPVECIEGYPCE